MTYTTYAIGDVHGRADLLVPLLKAIGRKAEASGREPRVLFLGDIVDRGPFSRQAFDLVCDTLDRWPLSRLIRGNHDAYFLEFMTASEVDEDRFYRWLLRLGGYATIESYGLVSENSIADVAAVFRANFTRHLSALREAASIIVDERFAYVHAGISPSRPISDQDPKEIMTIRSGFLDYEGDLSHVIVHGHTVTASRRAELKSNRIALDTGAYATGRLTCLAVLSDEKNLEFLTAAQNASGINVISGGVFSSTAVVERHTAG